MENTMEMGKSIESENTLTPEQTQQLDVLRAEHLVALDEIDQTQAEKIEAEINEFLEELGIKEATDTKSAA